MIELFRQTSEISALTFLNGNARTVSLIIAPGFLKQVVDLYQDHAVEDVIECEVLPLNEAPDKLKLRQEADEAGRVYVVANETGEQKCLRQLRAAFPGLHFVGLGETVFPALVARQGRAALKPLPRRLNCHTVVLIFATPRSGSSLVADIVSDLGMGDTREHLRQMEIAALSSSYKFNRQMALKNLVNLSGNNGYFSTKIISHFLLDYMRDVRDFQALKIFKPGLKVKAVVLDRSNKVAQAVSADLAMQRGVWHVRSGKDAKKIEQSKALQYNFGRLNARLFEYRQQSCILDFAREIFPDHLTLDYETDIDGSEIETLARRISDAVELTDPPNHFRKSRARQKIANEDNDNLVKKFRSDYEAVFGYVPK